MEYLTGVRHKDTLEISELRKQAQPGQTVKVNGAVHAIRNMGTVAFVILRKREGLLQGVYEEGTAKFDLKDIKEAATIEVEGVLEENEKAPGGIEIRMENLKIDQGARLGGILCKRRKGCKENDVQQPVPDRSASAMSSRGNICPAEPCRRQAVPTLT